MNKADKAPANDEALQVGETISQRLRLTILKSGMRPVLDKVLSDGSLLLLEDHENDADDLVPELSYPVVEELVKEKAKQKRTDFAG